MTLSTLPFELLSAKRHMWYKYLSYMASYVANKLTFSFSCCFVTLCSLASRFTFLSSSSGDGSTSHSSGGGGSTIRNSGGGGNTSRSSGGSTSRINGSSGHGGGGSRHISTSNMSNNSISNAGNICYSSCISISSCVIFVLGFCISGLIACK